MYTSLLPDDRQAGRDAIRLYFSWLLVASSGHYYKASLGAALLQLGLGHIDQRVFLDSPAAVGQRVDRVQLLRFSLVQLVLNRHQILDRAHQFTLMEIAEHRVHGEVAIRAPTLFEYGLADPRHNIDALVLNLRQLQAVLARVLLRLALAHIVARNRAEFSGGGVGEHPHITQGEELAGNDAVLPLITVSIPRSRGLFALTYCVLPAPSIFVIRGDRIYHTSCGLVAEVQLEFLLVHPVEEEHFRPRIWVVLFDIGGQHDEVGIHRLDFDFAGRVYRVVQRHAHEAPISY